MNQLLFSGATFRVAEWTFTLLALAGIGVCTITAIDAHLDLRSLLRARLNGSLRATGHIARRGALASMGMHVGFAAIGITGLLGRLPAPNQYERSELVALAFIAMQAGVVYGQIRNQFDRSALRRSPGGDRP